MVWASKMGRKFDPDAKRWRYRSSLLFALGNGLEVMTYVFPAFFLLLATTANCFKQMSMLTSSATRNAIYNSFRDGTRENIGDITAKGEAQIAVVDLLGILSGICLSRLIGTSVRNVLTVWITLQIIEVTCVYKEIRAVVFRMLNFERLSAVVDRFLSTVMDENGDGMVGNGSVSSIAANIPTPDMIAKGERIFLPPHHLARRAITFGSFGRSKLSPKELEALISIFDEERFMLIVGEDIKNKRRRWSGQRVHSEASDHCHIVLHEDATNADIVKSTLALAILRRNLAGLTENLTGDDILSLRSSDCLSLIKTSRDQADVLFVQFLKVLSVRGWATPARFMFGRVSMRAGWPIRNPKKSK